MIVDGFEIVLSPLEELRFGYRTARAKGVNLNNLHMVLNFCRDKDIQFLIARCSMHNIEAVQSMESEGFFLADTLVYYGRNLNNSLPTRAPTEVTIRPMADGENAKLQAIAEKAFSNYKSHYHADKRLDAKKCDDIYIDWIMNACGIRNNLNEVFVAQHNDNLLAFATLRMNDLRQGEGVLFGVHPCAQGLGIYQTLMKTGMYWCADHHAEEMIVSTQIINISVQKVWCRLGFEPRTYIYTLHKWFE